MAVPAPLLGRLGKRRRFSLQPEVRRSIRLARRLNPPKLRSVDTLYAAGLLAACRANSLRPARPARTGSLGGLELDTVASAAPATEGVSANFCPGLPRPRAPGWSRVQPGNYPQIQ